MQLAAADCAMYSYGCWSVTIPVHQSTFAPYTSTSDTPGRSRFGRYGRPECNWVARTGLPISDTSDASSKLKLTSRCDGQSCENCWGTIAPTGERSSPSLGEHPTATRQEAPGEFLQGLSQRD